MNELDQLAGLLDSKTAHVLTVLGVGAGVVGRIYKAIVNGGGFVSIWHALLYGTNTPKPPTESEPVKITNLAPLILAALCLSVAGCAFIRVNDPQTGRNVVNSFVPSWPWQDSARTISGLNITSRTNNFTTRVAAIDESQTTTTNATQLMESVVSAAVGAAVKAAK